MQNLKGKEKKIKNKRNLKKKQKCRSTKTMQ